MKHKIAKTIEIFHTVKNNIVLHQLEIDVHQDIAVACNIVFRSSDYE
jgi:hypothetical protein